MNRFTEAIIPRVMERQVLKALRQFPVVIVTGARQTGKSTLVTMPSIGSKRIFRSLDDYDVLERAEKEPDSLISESALMTLDEVQRAPKLLVEIKREVDKKRQAGRFLLTGSANLLMMRQVSESLSGRAVYLHLWPMTESEKLGRPTGGPWSALMKAKNVKEALSALKGQHTVSLDIARSIQVGGYPLSVIAKDSEERSAWFESYLRTYLERDLQDIAAIDAIPDLRRLMRLAALRIGQLLNQTELSRDAGLSQPTAHRYLNLFETTFQIIRVPAFAVNRTKRLVKSPKIYWNDAGVATHLAGLSTMDSLKSSSLFGALLENLVLLDLLVWRETATPRPEIHYWRTHSGDEVDFVTELGPRLLPIEVKMKERIRTKDIDGLKVFLDEYPKAAPFGMILYGGTEVFLLSERIIAVPFRIVLGGG